LAPPRISQSRERMIIRLYKQEVPLVTIETLTHTNRSQIYRVLRRNFIPKGRASPKRISEGKIALIRDLRKEGWTVKAVAKELKISHNTVSRYSKAPCQALCKPHG
jgi:DNA invertase Pin-like site-specific DNA recombinase